VKWCLWGGISALELRELRSIKLTSECYAKQPLRWPWSCENSSSVLSSVCTVAQDADAGEGGGGTARNSGETASADGSHVHSQSVAKANNV
jgi:hypothetical protein